MNSDFPVLGGSRVTRILASQFGIGKETKVLNIGVNLKESSVYLADKFGCRVFAVSEVPDVIVSVKSEAGRKSLKIEAKVMSPLALDFDDGFFDLVICEGVMSQYRKSDFLKEIHRVLKPGGGFGVADFYWRKIPVPKYVLNVWSWDEGRVETLDEVIKLMKGRGFDVFFIHDVSGELKRFYSELLVWIEKLLKTTYLSSQQFKEVKRFRHEANVFLKQGGNKWMGYSAIASKKQFSLLLKPMGAGLRI